MDFALLNVNDKSLSKSTPNLAARRASDVGQSAAIALDGQEKGLCADNICLSALYSHDILTCLLL